MSAHDREAIRSRIESRLRPRHGRELFLETLGKPLVELLLIQVTCQVARIDVVGRRGIVVVPKVRKRILDSRPLSRKQIPRPIRFHGTNTTRGPALAALRS